MKLKNLILPILLALFLLVASGVSAYTVVPGDTLCKIGQSFGMTCQEIILVNPQVTNPDLIYPGQVIYTGVIGDNLGSAPIRPSDIDIKIRQSLVAGASRTGTTLNLDPIIDPASGHRWTMAEIGSIAFGTLEPGTTNKEIISWTGMIDNTTYYQLTGVSWGYDATGLTTSTANYKRHNSGARFIITNDDQYLNSMYMNLGYAQTATGIKTFTNFPVMSSATGLPTTNGQLATKYYVDTVGAGGFTSANVSTTRGLSVDGSSPEKVGVNASTTTGLYFDSSGKLAASSTIITAPLLTSNNTWSGTNTFNGTTTLNGPMGATVGFTRIAVVTTTGTSTWARPEGVTKIKVKLVGGGGYGGGVSASSHYGAGGGGGGGYCEKIIDVSATSSIFYEVATSSATSTFGTYCYAYPGKDVQADTNAGGIGGIATGGDINISGQNGGYGGNTSDAGDFDLGGYGGNSMLGFGGQMVTAKGGGNTKGVTPTSGYGGGGSGSANNNSGGSYGLTIGAKGVLIIEY